ncbi:MAG: sulfite exporter TauE/SafE family protein [Nanoarchaeota archaeon]
MQEILIFIIGLVAGFLGASVGGGGFLSIPLFIILGFTPQASIALNKVGDIGTFFSATSKYWKSKKIEWKLAGIITVIYIIGSIIGTQIMVNLKTNILENLILISIILAFPFLFTKKMGLVTSKVSRLKKIIGFGVLFFLSIMGAIVGAGGAVLSTLVMMLFFGQEIVRGHATTTPSKFFSALIPSIVYSFHGFVEIFPGLIVFSGMLIGGFFGARTAIIEGNRWVKTLYTIVIVALIIKIAFSNFS